MIRVSAARFLPGADPSRSYRAFDQWLIDRAKGDPKLMNAVNVSVQRWFPGSGVSAYTAANNLMSGLAITSGTSYYLPATTAAYTTAQALPYGYTAGRIRVKIYNGAGTSPTLTKLQVAAQDGTNTVIIFDYNFGTAVTLSTTSWFDSMFDFCVDTAASGNGGGAVGQLIAPTASAAGGLTNIRLVATLGGTSPAATMDAELIGLI